MFTELSKRAIFVSCWLNDHYRDSSPQNEPDSFFC